MDSCAGCHNITEVLLKMALNTMQSINQLLWLFSDERNSKFVHTNSTPVLQSRRDSGFSITSMDVEEADEGLDEQDGSPPTNTTVADNDPKQASW